MIKRNRSLFKNLFKDFGYKVVRLKYFIMVVAALIFEIIAVTIFILNIENLLELQLFTTSVLFGITSAIIIVLAVGILVLIEVDKNRDIEKIERLMEFRKEHNKVQNNYLGDINKIERNFNNEKDEIESKINYALTLKDIYDNFLKGYSKIKVPSFLKDSYHYELEHLQKEKQFYEMFSQLAGKDDLENIVFASEIAHRNYLKEIEKIEKNLKLII
jgi:hypothetical protein